MSTLHSETYKKALLSLIQGNVICRWSDPSGAEILERQETRERINHWSGELDMELAQTTSENGWFLVYRSIDPHTRSVARDLFSGIMKELRFYVRMLELFMNTQHRDASMSPGETMRLSNLMQAMDESPDLRAQLADLPTSRKTSVVKDQVEALIGKLKREGVIVESNAKHSIFTFTAKIDLIQDIIIFIQENEHIPIQEAEDDAQAELKYER